MKMEELIRTYKRAAFQRLCGLTYQGSNNTNNVGTLIIGLENQAFSNKEHMMDCFNSVTRDFERRVGLVDVIFRIEYIEDSLSSVCKILIVK